VSIERPATVVGQRSPIANGQTWLTGSASTSKRSKSPSSRA
jgi:hypothetical protein